MKTAGRIYIVRLGIPAFLLAIAAWSFALMNAHEALSQEAQSQTEVTVPSRPSTPLFQGEQGKQRSEVEFDSSNRVVTLKLQVQDPYGYFLPNIRRENFAVYEDQQQQKIVSVDIEHASVSLALLVEFGGRYLEMNKVLALEIPEIGHALLETMTPGDKIGIFKYDSKLETLADFSQDKQALVRTFDSLPVPGFSEANFYDAVSATLHRVQGFNGRRAIVAVSTGIDTFSQENYDQVLQEARTSEIPIYAIGLSRLIQKEITIYGANAPTAHLDWPLFETRLEGLSKVSGGRAYILDTDLQVTPVCDDIMENLRVRYVITYVSSNPAASGPPRKIHVELIDPKTGKSLVIRDSDGKPVTANVLVQESYTPGPSSGN